MPSQAKLKASKKKVFAHYFTLYPITLDNEAPLKDYYNAVYLNKNGENDKHLYCGGLLRDRPISRSISSSKNWKTDDLEAEIRTAQAAGLDGFTVDLLSIESGNELWEQSLRLAKAASKLKSGFSIVPMPDMTALENVSSAQLADALATMARQPSTFKSSDGRVVISPFHAEAREPAWWKEVFATMKTKHGISTSFVPTFLDYFANAEKFDPMIDGAGNWGMRNPKDNQGLAATIKKAKAKNKIWMQPVSVQDERPNTSVYDEANNTENLRVTWKAAIEGGADWVQLVTWNDSVREPVSRHLRRMVTPIWMSVRITSVLLRLVSIRRSLATPWWSPIAISSRRRLPHLFPPNRWCGDPTARLPAITMCAGRWSSVFLYWRTV